jgi:hypothetical protein
MEIVKVKSKSKKKIDDSSGSSKKAKAKRKKEEATTTKKTKKVVQTKKKNGSTPKKASPPPSPTTKKQPAKKKSNSLKKKGVDDDDNNDALNIEVDENLLFMTNDKLSKSLEPCDKYDINRPDNITIASKKDQSVKATKVIKKREKQRIFDLAIEQSQAYFNDIENEPNRMFGPLPAAIYPMQRFLMNGFLPVDNMNPAATISCVTRNLKEECDFINSEKLKQRELDNSIKSSSSSTNTPSSIKTNGPGNTDQQGKKRDLSNTKLNQVWGTTYHSFGYNRRIPKELKLGIDRAYIGEKVKIFKLCYDDDCIEPDVEFGSMPSNSRMFNQTRDTHYMKYKCADKIVLDSAKMIPRPQIEVIDRAYFRKYRRKPEPNEQVELCASGTRCVFNVIIRNKHQAYIARIFYSRNEIRHKIIYNKERLCIDCLLKLWTKVHDQNVSHEIDVQRPFNYFSVKVGPKEYSSHCLLSNIENDRPTGIEGHVPRFSGNNRRNAVVVKNYDDGNQIHTTFTPYLEEIGMDF